MKARGSVDVLNRSVDGLTLKERSAIAGSWVATQFYSPQTLPLRVVHAIGATPRDCIQQLLKRNLDPTEYHYELMSEPIAF